MKIRTADLTGAALDWAVAKVEERHIGEGYYTGIVLRGEDYHPATDWSQGGPIMAKLMGAGLVLVHCKWAGPENRFRASLDTPNALLFGPTVLVALCRCYVNSVLGNEIDIPDELKE